MDPVWPPGPPNRYDAPPRQRTSAWMISATVGVGAVLLVVGFGLGYLIWNDEDEPQTAAPAVPTTTTEEPPAELPDDFPVEITVQFFDAAPPEHRQAVRREFEQSGLFDDFEFEYFGPLDDGPWNTITGSGHQDDDEAICDFGRQYLADPLVDGVVSRGTNECPDL